MVESLGMSLPQNAAIPAVDSRRSALAQLSGRRIVQMVHDDVRMSKILTRDAFENAIRVNAAIGGSSNFIIHLLAIAGRLGVPLELDDFDRIGHDLPLLADLMPSGRFLMEDFYYAGGIPAVVHALGDIIAKDAITVNGCTIGENTGAAPCWNPDVIRTVEEPVQARAGIALLKGNLAPQGAVIKPSAATPALLHHRGRAVVFESVEEMKGLIDDPDLDVNETCVLVLKGAGPKGYPGMPEVGNMPLPRKLLERGVKDMVRISDGRMSGTAYGAVVLHTAPEAAIGGPLALVRNGDFIELDVEARLLHLDVSDAELESRRAAWRAPPPPAGSGYQKLYIDHVMQADTGADLGFLVGCRGADVPKESH